MITPDENRFHNQPDVLDPESDLKKAKFILCCPDKMASSGLSDKLLWEHCEVFKFINTPRMKSNIDFTVIFPLLDLLDMAWNERNTSLTVRGLTSKTELNRDCVGWLASRVMDIIDKRFEYWESIWDNGGTTPLPQGNT